MDAGKIISFCKHKRESLWQTITFKCNKYSSQILFSASSTAMIPNEFLAATNDDDDVPALTDNNVHMTIQWI